MLKILITAHQVRFKRINDFPNFLVWASEADFSANSTTMIDKFILILLTSLLCHKMVLIGRVS